MEELYFFIAITIVALTLPLIAFRLGKEWLISLAVVYLITGNVFAQSFVNLFGLMTSFAIPVYGAVFLITDLLSEYHGKKAALQAVWIGISAQFVFLIVMVFILYSPTETEYLEAYQAALATVPRLVVGSFIAYLVSQHIDVFVYHRIKELSNHKTTKIAIAVRNNVSTWISQAFDTIIFLTIGFLGTAFFPTFKSLIGFIIFTWLFKIFIALFDTLVIIISRRLDNKDFEIASK